MVEVLFKSANKRRTLTQPLNFRHRIDQILIFNGSYSIQKGEKLITWLLVHSGDTEKDF